MNETNATENLHSPNMETNLFKGISMINEEVVQISITEE